MMTQEKSSTVNILSGEELSNSQTVYHDGGYYAVIPATVLYDDELSSSEKLFYAIISQLANKEGYCWASNQYLADICKVKNDSIQRWLRRLTDKEYIYIDYIYAENKKEITGKRIFPMVCPIKNNSTSYYLYTEGPIKNNREINITSNNIRTNKYIYPSLEEVEQYAKDRKSNVNPKAFYEYYTEGQWKDAKGQKVRNWKQKFITWEKNSSKQNKLPDFYNNANRKNEIEMEAPF